MREPWSLLLQIAGLLLLLLAIAQLQWGSHQRRGRDHVLLLDTSAWSAENGRQESILDREKRAAQVYFSRIPSGDRVMVVRVDSLAVPVTPFTANRSQLMKAVYESRSGFSALNLEQALSLAQQALTWSGGRSGEVVYVGPGMNGDEPAGLPDLQNLRTIGVDAVRDNVGIRHISVRRNEEDSSGWQASIILKNYGGNRRSLRLKTQFAGTVFASRSFDLGPEEEAAAEYSFTTDTAGELKAEITPRDDLPADDVATLHLPKSGPLHVMVYTKRKEGLRPLMTANHRLIVQFANTAEYSGTEPADLYVIDGFAPKTRPKVASLWIAPPREDGPLPVNSVLENAVVKNWNNESSIGEGLHAKDARIPSAEVFEVFEGDIPVASVAEGPIVVARPATQSEVKMAVIGFDPLQGQLKFEVTTPILVANLLRWLAPEAYRTLDVSAGRVGVATIALEPRELVKGIRVTDENGFSIPFTVRAKTLQLFASRPSLVRVVSDDRERLLSLTLPDVAEFEWKPPAKAVRGLPLASRFEPAAIDLWKWLALLGAGCFLAEWLLYGRQRHARFPRGGESKGSNKAAQTHAELVSK